MKRLKRIGLALLLVFGLSSTLAAQDPMVLLEKAIYTEETLGNLNEAIGLYQKVAADVNATRTTSALALFRLGMCYQKNRNDDQAQTIFSKLIKLYPEQQDLIALIPAPAANPLGLKPAPWADGEVLQLSAKLAGGYSIGTLTYQFDLETDAGRKVWNLQTVQSGRSLNASVLADTATLIPIRSVVKQEGLGREFNAKYGARQIEYSMSINGASGTKIIPLTKVTYDDLQIIQFLRCLPLQEGFQISLSVFNSGPNYLKSDAQIEVVAKERLTVPAGTFDCYKTIVTRGNQSPSSTYWISDDIHSYIVKASENRLWVGTVYRLLDLELASVGIAGN
jgi:tetratricopeptide (TPR) repeat protein